MYNDWGDVSDWVEVEPNRWHKYANGERIENSPEIMLMGDITIEEHFKTLKNPSSPKRTVAKSTIVSRLIETGKIEAAYAALTADPAAWARWVASDRPVINYDDPDAIALLNAIGANPDEILAP